MAKKEKKSSNQLELKPGHKLGSAMRCKESHCMGKPKELIESSVMSALICKECFAVYSYLPAEEKENQQKLEIKAEKIKEKTLTTDEKELEKLIKEADKKEKKKVKTQSGEQGSLF